MGKDYYAILGVTPFAEDIVIRAAYKALAQRYHPDRYQGSAEEANRKMVEINEAFAVLGDPIKRKEYDTKHAGIRDGAPYFGDGDGDSPLGPDPLENDWQVAVGFFPDLQTIVQKLKKVSWKLSYSYKAYLLETKNFNGRKTLAEQFELYFLQSYFGKDPEIVRFARCLIDKGMRTAALELNEAIRVLGNGVNPFVIIKKIKDKHHLDNDMPDVDELIDKITRTDPYQKFFLMVQLIEKLGGSFKWVSKSLFSKNILLNRKCSVEIKGQVIVFNNAKQFVQWVDNTLIPSL